MIINNGKKIDKLTKLIEESMEKFLTKGKYGKLVFSIKIHDGSIQDIERQEIDNHK